MVICEVLTATSMKLTVFWDVALCSLVEQWSPKLDVRDVPWGWGIYI
jgi:hypothetical protein